MSKARWRDRAKCLAAPVAPGDWDLFPEDRNTPGSAAYVADVERVRAEFCWACPARVECLADAIRNDEQYGMFGGLTPEDRQQVTQTACHCGAPIDPKDMLSTGRKHYCPNHVPILFDRSSKV